MNVPQEKLEELQKLQREYEQLRALQASLAVEVERLNAFKKDAELAAGELEELKEEKEALVPMGPVFVKSKLQTKVLYPLGANVYLSTKPEEAVQRLKEDKKKIEEQLKLLEAELAKVTQALTSIEARVAEIYRELNVAGAPKEGTQGTGQRGS
ncbi:prefoldin, alpha subunit [Ignicoccus hospitalis KIN4/I]|uniref:Prefoldin subunit alpha n=1 Tax=Ignicoccus hospitalis (strain KIN4/I / DSM 18386 / JCM 14125) TaxID=453591 RepID=A8ABQ1_IGNH4|nr:prefoldin, alpha subunit [Ignicoccus hospitalis KIN4/I]